MEFKQVKDDLRAPTNSHPEDAPILALLRKGKTGFVTDFTENDFRRFYGAIRKDPERFGGLRLRRKRREVDDVEGHVIWLE